MTNKKEGADGKDSEDVEGASACATGCAWRMIGHLQSNKAAKAAELFTAIDSVDSLALAGTTFTQYVG